MASYDGHVKIGTELDESGLKKDLKSTEKNSKKTFEQLAKESGKTVEELRADAKKIAEAYQKQGINIPNSYKKAYADMGVYSEKSKEDMTNDADKIGDSHEKNSEKAKDSWKKAFSGIGSLAGKGLSEIGSLATKGFSVLGSAAKAAAKVAVTAVASGAAAIGTAVGASIKVGMEFEAEMSKVESICGATGDELAALTEKAKEMGAKTKFSASEAAEAMEYMAMAGWKTSDMLGGIEGIMNLAAASGEDLATTSDIVTDAMTAFGLAADGTTTVIKNGLEKEVSNASHFADVLASASSNANTNVSLMGDTFKYVAPVAGALGYSAEDTAVAIGLMANSGIKASQAGTSLRAMLSRLAKPTDEVEAAMSQLGISLTNSDGSMKSLNEMMLDLRQGFSGLSEAESASMAASLAGQEAMSGLLAIVTASDSDFDKLTAAINDCDGAAEQMAATAQDNLQGQLTILKSSAEALGNQIYESLEEPLKNIASFAVNALGDLNTAFEKEGVNGLIKAGSRLLGDMLLGMAEKAPELVDMAVNVSMTFIRQISKSLPEFLITGEGILASLAEGMGEILPEITNLGLQLITGLLYLIAEHAPEALACGSGILVSIMDGINDRLPMLMTVALAALTSFTTGILENLPQIAESGGNLLQTLTTGILDSIPQLAGIALQVLDFLSESLTTNMPSIVESGKQALQDFTSGIIEKLPEIIDSGVTIVTELINGLSQMLPDIAVSAMELFTTLLTSLCSPDNLNQIIESGIQLILGLVTGLLDALPDLLNAVPEIIGNLVAAIIANIPRLLEAAVEIMLWLGEFLLDNVRKLTDPLPYIFAHMTEAFADMDWGEIGTNLIEGIKNGIIDAASGLAQSAMDAAKGALDAIKGFLGIHSPSRLMRDVVGKNMIAGMEVGMEEETPQLEDTSIQSARTAVSAMRSVSASDAVSAIQSRAYAASERAMDAALYKAPDQPSPGNTPQPELIDYDRMGREMAKAVDGMEVQMDGKKVGKIVTPAVNEELEKIRKRKT